MAQIKSKDTKPEIFVCDALTRMGMDYRKHYPTHGTPDLAFPEKKIAVFISGEFWHGRNFSKWRHKLSDFWLKKIGGNIRRDKRNFRLLKEEGWQVIRIWDKDLKKNPEKELKKILKVTQAAISP